MASWHHGVTNKVEEISIARKSLPVTPHIGPIILNIIVKVLNSQLFIY